jgi:hypothetical protein
MPKSSREYPTLVTWTDPQGKVHIPPDPPLVEGYPPWFPRPNEYRRTTPLKRCPSLTCRRTHSCASLLYGKFCQKTHMDRESFRYQIIARIDAITRSFGREPVEYDGGPIPTPPPEMKRALQARQDELEHEHLLEWQTGWIERQKKKAKKPLEESIFAVE